MTDPARPVRGTERMRASDPNHWRRVVNCCEVEPAVGCYATDPGLVLDGTQSLGDGAPLDERERRCAARSYMDGWIVSVHKVMGEAGYMAPGLPPDDRVALRAGSLDGLAVARRAIDVAEHGDLPQKE